MRKMYQSNAIPLKGLLNDEKKRIVHSDIYASCPNVQRSVHKRNVRYRHFWNALSNIILVEFISIIILIVHVYNYHTVSIVS